MYYVPKAVISTLAGVVLASSVAASSLPIQEERSHKFGSKRYSYSSVTLNASGVGLLQSDYSNCSYVGGTWGTYAILIDKDGKKLGVVELKAGMSMRVRGCNERSITKRFQMTPVEARDVARIEIHHKDLNTNRAYEEVLGWLGFLADLLGGPTGEADNGVHWRR